MNKLKHLKKASIPFLLLFNVVSIITTQAQHGWEQMAPMKIAKGGSQSCVIDSMIYVFGGWDENLSGLNSAEVYDTETNEWIDLKPIPIDVYESNAEAINGKIYLTGGWRRGITVKTSYTSNLTFKYNPEEDIWMEKENCLVNTGTNTSCVLNEKIYILGGLHDFADNDTSGQKQAFVYDPVMDTWDSIPDMLYERAEGAAASVIDNKIYVCGGLYAISDEQLFIVGKTEMYDPVSNKWKELEDMPVPVVNHISLVYNEKLYVFGGDSGKFTVAKSYSTNIIQEYNPATNKWKLMQNMPFKRGNMTGQKVGNYLYLIGGYLESRDFHHPLSEVWRFNLDSLKYLVNTQAQQAFLNQTDIRLFPNPASDLVHIEGLKNPADIIIYSITGHRLKSFQQVNNTIDISELRTGVYNVNLILNDKMVVRKVVKE